MVLEDWVSFGLVAVLFCCGWVFSLFEVQRYAGETRYDGRTPPRRGNARWGRDHKEGTLQKGRREKPAAAMAQSGQKQLDKIKDIKQTTGTDTLELWPPANLNLDSNYAQTTVHTVCKLRQG